MNEELSIGRITKVLSAVRENGPLTAPELVKLLNPKPGYESVIYHYNTVLCEAGLIERKRRRGKDGDWARMYNITQDGEQWLIDGTLPHNPIYHVNFKSRSETEDGRACCVVTRRQNRLSPEEHIFTSHEFTRWHHAYDRYHIVKRLLWAHIEQEPANDLVARFAQHHPSIVTITQRDIDEFFGATDQQQAMII